MMLSWSKLKQSSSFWRASVASVFGRRKPRIFRQAKLNSWQLDLSTFGAISLWLVTFWLLIGLERTLILPLISIWLWQKLCSWWEIWPGRLIFVAVWLTLLLAAAYSIPIWIGIFVVGCSWLVRKYTLANVIVWRWAIILLSLILIAIASNWQFGWWLIGAHGLLLMWLYTVDWWQETSAWRKKESLY